MSIFITHLHDLKVVVSLIIDQIYLKIKYNVSVVSNFIVCEQNPDIESSLYLTTGMNDSSNGGKNAM